MLLEEARVKNIFKELCSPDGFITVDSLGHSLQKYHIDFNLRKVADMIGLFWMFKEEEVPEGDGERLLEDKEGLFDISLKIDYEQFDQLFRTVRGGKK